MHPIPARIKWRRLNLRPGFSTSAIRPPRMGGIRLTVKAKGRTALHHKAIWDMTSTSQSGLKVY